MMEHFLTSIMAAPSMGRPITWSDENSNNDHSNNLEENASAWRHGSFSDWTIKVVCLSEGNDTDVDSDQYRNYHVHRVYLASGPRRSEYFQTLFSMMSSSSSRNNDDDNDNNSKNVTAGYVIEEITSRITKLPLPESAYRAFPRFLDYIYDGVFGVDEGLRCDDENNDDNLPRSLFQDNNNDNDNVNDNVKNSDKNQQCNVTSSHCGKCPREAVAIAFLADYLRVPKLIPKTKLLVRSLLDDSNIHIVYQEALLYGIDWIIEDCIAITARSPRDLLSPSLLSSPAKLTMELMSPERQIQLLQLSLSHSLKELEQFKRVPSRWKDNIDDVVATHMPTLMINNNISNQSDIHDNRQHNNNHRTRAYLLPTQGCGLPFPGNKICPLFYFDQPLPRSLSPLPPPSQPR